MMRGKNLTESMAKLKRGFGGCYLPFLKLKFHVFHIQRNGIKQSSFNIFNRLLSILI